MILWKPYSQHAKEDCLQIFESNCPTYFSEIEYDDFKYWLEKEVTKENRYWLGYDDNQIVACGGIYVSNQRYGKSSFSNEVGFAWGMVHSERHGQGLGSNLLAFRLSYLRDKYTNCPIVLRTTQYTYLFFTKFGFEVVEVEKNGYGDDFDKITMIFNTNNI